VTVGVGLPIHPEFRGKTNKHIINRSFSSVKAYLCLFCLDWSFVSITRTSILGEISLTLALKPFFDPLSAAAPSVQMASGVNWPQFLVVQRHILISNPPILISIKNPRPINIFFCKTNKQ